MKIAPFAPITRRAAQPAPPEPPKRDLGPCHHWLSDRDEYLPTPRPEPGQWKALKHYEVVVVGGGIGGLNTAWRLQEQGHQVAVFERTRHAGGRVRSKTIENQKPLDLGAMRYIPSRHQRVRHLVEDVLQLPTRDFVVGGDNNLQYFRGQRLTNAEAAAHPEKRPFHLRPEEQGKSVDELLALAIRSVVPNFEHLCDADWDRVLTETRLPFTDPATGQTSEVPLSQLGLRNILSHSLSQEAQTLITESVGYNTFLANWDAGQALKELAADFRPGTSYKTPIAGMEAIPRGLLAKFREAGGEFNNLTTLRAVDYDPAQGFLLQFSKGDKIEHVVADKLVLNLPKRPLQDLLANSPDLAPLQAKADKVTGNPMTRIFATYPRAWWKDEGIESGRSLTDLPLGQVYYYGDESDKRPYVMVYSDGADSQYWEGLQNPSEPGVEKRLCVKPQLAQELQRQMEELHGRDLPEPDGFLYKRWASEYTGGAYHTWNPGGKPWETSQQMLQPLGDAPLFVVGEAYSTTQGWIEGALETSEEVLDKLGCKP
ncbi:MAG: flavin monoamine oxidase family protein [Vulcanimicrobiota bacterium]